MCIMHPVRIVASVLTLALVVLACSEVPPPPEPEPDPAPPLELPPTADRLDTIAWIEEQTYGQAVTTVYRDTLPTCASCEIRLVPVGSFGRADDEVLLVDLPVRVERDGRGRFYATAVGWIPEIIVYEPDGTIARTVGQEGEGPGEFLRYVTDILIGPDDSLFVAHDGMRFSVFDSSGTAAGTRLLEAGGAIPSMRLVQSSKDELVLSYPPSHSAVGDQLHQLNAFDREGTHLRSFGPVGVESLQAARELPDDPIRTGAQAWASTAPDGAIWVWFPHNYRLKRIGRGSAVDRVIGIANPESWHGFLRMSSLDELRILRREAFQVDGFHQIDDTLGVAVLSVPSHGWEEVELRRHPRYPADTYASDVWQEFRDSVIDIIHIPTGEVLARRRIPQPSYLTSDGTLYSVTVSDLGVISVEAFRIEVLGPDGASE